ncbi:PAN/Apple domain [Trinorchestia longiramus]|nr:PAN/Apple domain [Trinorchestia longiramus]
MSYVLVGIQESLSVSQFPVFTLYAQKICLPKSRPACRSPWAYETVPEFTILSDMVTETAPAQSRTQCATLCLLHERFTCRSAAYNREKQTCAMSQVDRNMAGRKKLVAIDSKNDYMELSCALKPDRMCEFQSIREKIMKTVDAVHLDTASTDECRQRCLDADFGCYSYDYRSAGEPICRLSHHSSASLAHIQEPYLPIENATTYELQACYQVTIECKASEMVATISTSTVFNGKVYARSRPNSCVEDIQNSTKFSIALPYNSVDCDVVQNGNTMFASNIVIQHHDKIVTRADVGLALHCKYELRNMTVTHSLLSGLEVKSDPATEYIQEVVVSSPNVTMRVTTPEGQVIGAAQVGDNLALRFEILDKESPYEIFVRELVALDGRDSSEIVLIDEDGCPTDPSIMQAIVQVVGGKVLHAPFQAFKFPATEVVQFRALVTPCHPKCEPAQCFANRFDGALLTAKSYGKRRRRREVQENDIMVAQSIHITDKFLFNDEDESEVEKLLSTAECDTSYTGIIIACALFLLAQLVILLVWSYQWHRKRATKEIIPHYPPVIRNYPRSRHSGSSSMSSSTAYLNR